MAWPLHVQLNPPSFTARLRWWLTMRYAKTGDVIVPIKVALQQAPAPLRRVARLDAALRELAAAGAVVVLRQGRRRTIRMDPVQLLRATLR